MAQIYTDNSLTGSERIVILLPAFTGWGNFMEPDSIFYTAAKTSNKKLKYTC